MQTSNVVVCAAVIAAASAIAATLSGHINRAPPTEVYTIRSDKWTNIRNNPALRGWFRVNLRCTREAFFRIVSNVENEWVSIHPKLHHNTVFDLTDRVACCLHYVTHADGYSTTGEIFGISKTQTRNYCRQVAQVLTKCYLKTTIKLPSSVSEWEVIRDGFERKAGFPNAYGAIDGSLIPVKRFADFMGWYCRKGFPAFNMQAMVDHKLCFRSYSIRSGSQNDKAVFNASQLGKKLHHRLPLGGCVVADAGQLYLNNYFSL